MHWQHACANTRSSGSRRSPASMRNSSPRARACTRPAARPVSPGRRSQISRFRALRPSACNACYGRFALISTSPAATSSSASVPRCARIRRLRCTRCWHPSRRLSNSAPTHSLPSPIAARVRFAMPRRKSGESAGRTSWAAATWLTPWPCSRRWRKATPIPCAPSSPWRTTL